MKKVTKLVLPVAGLGKRLLPLTEKTPKNLVPVNGKPLMDYVLEEAVESGIREVILIVGPKGRVPNEAYIKANQAYIKKNAKRFPTLKFHIRVQETPGGNGHAIAQAHDILGKNPFAVRFCDDIMLGNPPALKGLIDVFNRYHSSVILLESVPKKMVSRFGVVGFEKRPALPKFFGGRVYKLNRIIEKPKLKDAPSNLTIVGGYVLMPEILRDIKLIADTLPVVADDALPLAVALQIELILKGKVFGWEFPGRRLDCGTLIKLQEAEEFLRNS